jgi:hypothetical protein
MERTALLIIPAFRATLVLLLVYGTVKLLGDVFVN